MKLSIIIPYYNAKEYTDELLDVLAPQMTDEIECLLVDDGSEKPFKTKYRWCKVFRKENGGCATARNVGLDNATGEYVSFIDADDLVPGYFVEKLLEATGNKPDVIEFSWKSLSSTEGTQHNKKLNKPTDRLTNPSVCTRAFRRAFIGDVRFNEKKDSTEDEDFSRKIGYLDVSNNFKRAIIPEYMYYYRTAVSNSKIKRFKKGLMKTKRVVYYYKHVSSNMRWLIDEIKKEDEYNEVWLITERNDLPELKRYCQISKPISIWGHYLKGEPYSRFIKVEIPVKAQVIFYCEFANMIGGISTFLYNTCQHLKDEYDILILYDRFDQMQCVRLSKIVRVMKNNPKTPITCDTIVLNRLTDKVPENVTYKKSIQMCHACKQKIVALDPTNADYLVNVSQASKDSWGELSKDGIVIHNLSYPETKELMLVSATRMGVSDKGKNDQRIRALARMLNEKRIPFVWLNFSDKGLPDPPENFINMSPRVNIQNFIERADYLVQLSDVEAYSMSVLEALNLNTPVLATPFPSLFEEGFVDGVNGYVIPYDMKFDVEKLLTIPKFNFKYDNNSIIKQWKKLLGAPAPKRETFKEDGYLTVNIVREFKDRYTGELVRRGITVLPEKRVKEILAAQKEKRIKLIEVAESN